MEFSFQTGAAFGILCVVIFYLINRFVINPLRKSKVKQDHSCGPDCKCK